MIPTFFEWGPIKIHSFGFMMAVAFAATTILAGREFKRRGLDPDLANGCGLGAMIGGVLGAKIYFVLDHFSDFMASPWATLFSGAGLTWYGGLIGGALGALWMARRQHLPLLTLCDVAAPLMGLGYAIGRVGCFLNGDDYGRPTDLPWGVEFPRGSPPTPAGTPVHPTQLYEVAGGLFIYFLLSALKTRVIQPGRLFGLYLALAGVARFLVEFVRTNEPGIAGLTFAQWISVGLIAAGLALARRTTRRENVGVQTA